MSYRRFSLLLVPAFLFGCRGEKSHKEIHASGHIEVTQARLAAQVPGLLAEAPWQEGQRVDKGQVVARLDTALLQRELERAQAEREAAHASLRSLLAGTRREEIAEARARLAATQAELAAAEADVARFRPLAERGTAARKLAEDAESRAQVLRQQAEALKARLALLEAGPRREEIEQARARLAAAKAAVRSAEQRLADATVLAPFSGVITTRVAEPGEFLPAGAPVAVLSDLDHPWLEVFVDEPALSRIRLGQKVRVQVDGRKEPLTGTVTYIAQQAEFTPKNVQTPDERAKLVFRVKIALPQQDGLLKPGMPADAYFSTQE